MLEEGQTCHLWIFASTIMAFLTQHSVGLLLRYCKQCRCLLEDSSMVFSKRSTTFWNTVSLSCAYMYVYMLSTHRRLKQIRICAGLAFNYESHCNIVELKACFGRRRIDRTLLLQALLRLGRMRGWGSRVRAEGNRFEAWRRGAGLGRRLGFG